MKKLSQNYFWFLLRRTQQHTEHPSGPVEKFPFEEKFSPPGAGIESDPLSEVYETA